MTDNQPFNSAADFCIDQKLIEKYNTSGPRYTSYPTALQFSESFEPSMLIEQLKQSDQQSSISLYVHVPFCRNICYYCACNKVITKDYSKAARYIEAVLTEAKLIASHSGKRKVSQLHLGGGTPTFLDNKQLEMLVKGLANIFDFDYGNGEFSIEIDPRSIDKQTIPALRKMGFNRLSIGVQDFNEKVQKAVNRVHSEEEIRKILIQARGHGFESISMDLIYGLPLQTLASFEDTLDKIIKMAPDRLSVFNYAHLPHRFKPQRKIKTEDLPAPSVKLEILQLTINKLTQAGYIDIGMDHFALPHDELSKAQQNHSLHRNFQGYTTQADCELIGLGVSSISQIGDSYSQNKAVLDDYYDSIEQGQLAFWRGYQLDNDDLIRRRVIMLLICHFQLDFEQVEREYLIDFHDYFSDELKYLESYQADGLLTFDSKKILISPAGHFFIRNICMLFDVNLQEIAQIPSYSSVI